MKTNKDLVKKATTLEKDIRRKAMYDLVEKIKTKRLCY
jgi:hypothetical protein